MEPQFQPFDPKGPLQIYLRNLPHWRQPGATYFVTFRQDDSIPSTVLAEWLDVKARWAKAHGLPPVAWDSRPERSLVRGSGPGRYSINDQVAVLYRRIPTGIRCAFERRQARMLHEELDRCHGSCVLKHAAPRKIVSDSVPHFHGIRMWLGDFVVMPNHAHALVQPFDGFELEDLLGSVKRWTLRRIREWPAGQPGWLQPKNSKHNRERFWQPESYDRIVRDLDELSAFRRYIARNGEKSKLLNHEYTYHAAEWLDNFVPMKA